MMNEDTVVVCLRNVLSVIPPPVFFVIHFFFPPVLNAQSRICSISQWYGHLVLLEKNFTVSDSVLSE